MAELLKLPVAEETYTGHETTQVAYVRELARHAQAIPDVSELKHHHLSDEDASLLSSYASHYNNAALQEKGIVPLYRDDIIDPGFCKSVGELIRTVAENSSTHWYRPAGWDHHDNFYTQQGRFLSRQWDIAFVDYMRQRRLFHANFMQALLTKESIGTLVGAIGFRNGAPVTTPPLAPAQHGSDRRQAPALARLYNRTNWLTTSILSVLALPPELCNADMKRHAIEQWAQYADVQDTEAQGGFYNLNERLGPTRLPWAMRSNAEMSASRHPSWRQNQIIKAYFGDSWEPRADGHDALLQERPKDYIQVLVLNIFDIHTESGLASLARAAALPPEIKDIIFAEDAAHNTIYSDKPVLPAFGQPTTLLEWLEADRTELSPQTQETIIEAQRLRIQVLTGELATAQAAATRQNGQQYERLRFLEALVARQESHLPRSQADLLMLSFGISPAIGSDALEPVIGALRRKYNKDLHPQNGAGNEANEERLKEINNSLDEILRSRGLGKNREE